MALRASRLMGNRDALDYGGWLEVVSFATLVAMIAMAGLSVAVVTIRYAL